MYLETNIWKNSLEDKNDGFNISRERLRTSFASFREKVGHLVQSISEDSLGLTVHDLTHMDSLWQMADILTGNNYDINPAEAYVLGGAILLHDSALTVAAYIGKAEEVKNTLEYGDAYASITKDLTSQQINEPSIQIKAEKAAISEALRIRHASKAEELASQMWTSPIDGTNMYLIDDKGLRDHFSNLIGRIAHSHHWDINSLSEEFNTPFGACNSFPNNWVVDGVKVALLLRCIDAMHIDDRRAPSFLASIREIGSTSMEHWKFQNKVAIPHLEDNRITYTSKQPFGINDADAWNLCFDTIQMIDSELSNSHELHLLRKIPEFKGHGVAGAGSAISLAKYIKVSGWKPIPLSVKASDVPKLALTLGGNDLYNYPLAPLRELIQNAAYAIEARCLLDQNFSIDEGEIIIRLNSTETEKTLEVEDNGVGMSERVLTKALLDFGYSFWKSTEARKEFPGLQANADKFRGKYGIGFFSIFMWARTAEVFSHRFIEGQNSTKVIEFRDGLESRPIFRDAESSETSSKWCTKIKINIKPNVFSRYAEMAQRFALESRIRYHSSEFALDFNYAEKLLNLNQLKLLCGALPIKVIFIENGISTQVSLPKWRECSYDEFMNFFGGVAFPKDNYSNRFIKSLTPSSESEPLGGRCFISPNQRNSVAVYDKGIFVSFERIMGISGVALSSIKNAARDQFQNINLYKDITWAVAASEKAFDICENLGEIFSIQELLTKLSKPHPDKPILLRNRQIITISELKKVIKEGIFNIRLIGDSNNNYSWKKAEKLDLIIGLEVNQVRIYPLIKFDGIVKDQSQILDMINVGNDPLFVFLREVRDSIPNCKIEFEHTESGRYSDDYIDITFYCEDASA